MDKGFSISGYLLSRLQPDDPREARLRMLCVTISKDMPGGEKRAATASLCIGHGIHEYDCRMDERASRSN